jgi:hypothetical protein
MFRLISSIGMLGILILLVLQARREETWYWLTGDGKKQAATVDAKAPEVLPKATAKHDEPIEQRQTDLDPEEWAAINYEFQAISDRTLTILPEEMPAYWRIFGWSGRQTLAEMQKRAKKLPLMNDFAMRPDEQRGKLFTLDLNVRRILSYPAPENAAGVTKVYEIFGWTNESQAWPYIVLTSQLPPGMPEGVDVFERARFTGYFFKLQGYHEAGAKPNASPLSAPLLIGQMSWLPSAPVAVNPPAPPWVIWVGLAICGMIAVRLFMFMLSWRRGARTPTRPPVERAASGPADVQGWLASASDNASTAASANAAEEPPNWAQVHANGSTPHSNYSSPSDN